MKRTNERELLHFSELSGQINVSGLSLMKERFLLRLIDKPDDQSMVEAQRNGANLFHTWMANLTNFSEYIVAQEPISNY